MYEQAHEILVLFAYASIESSFESGILIRDYNAVKHKVGT